MAYAPHSNDSVRIAHRHGGEKPPLLLGNFIEADRHNAFEYAVRPDNGIDFAPDCPHIVYVGDGFRYAKVLKTVAWVAVDEQPDGSPVFEKWHLHRHRYYDTSWVFAD